MKKIFLYFILPLLIPIIAGLTIWRVTQDKYEITFKLDGYITIGSLQSKDLEGLTLNYRGKEIQNVLKISWRIINTGTKGIKEFEVLPTIVYPEGSDVAEARLGEKSQLLEFNTNLVRGLFLINRKNRTIRLDNIGIFNHEEYFTVSVYMINIPDELISDEYFANWKLMAKTLDLKIKNDISYKDGDKSLLLYVTIIILSLYVLTVSILLGLRILKKAK